MNKFLYNLKESRIFQFIVISIIILNAITIGVNTYDLSDLTKKLQDKVSLKEEVTKKLSSEEPELAKILKKIDKIENNTHWKSQAKIGIIVALIVGIPLFFIGWVLPSPFQP